MTRTLSYRHRGGEAPLLGATIPEHFAAVAERFPGNEAVVSLPQRRRLTYSKLKSEIDHLARGLLGSGFGKGDRIGVWSTDNIEWLLLQMATARIGAVLVNINPANRARELAHALQRSEVQARVLAQIGRITAERELHPGQGTGDDLRRHYSVGAFKESFG